MTDVYVYRRVSALGWASSGARVTPWRRIGVSLPAMLLIALLALAACQPSPARTVATPSAVRTATTTPAAIATPTRPVGPARYTQRNFVQGVTSPDDLTFDAQGRLLFVDLATGSVERREVNGALTILAHGLPTPEGVVALADGSLLVAAQGVAGQGIDEILRIPSQGGAPTVLAHWANTTGNEGLDNIRLDPTTGELLVPDSPNGVVYRLSLDGQRQTVVARGLVRPTDALADAATSALYVADEWGNRVVRVGPAGALTTLARLSYSDDLALDVDGSLLVTSLGDNTLVRLDPTTGAQLAVVASVTVQADPQCSTERRIEGWEQLQPVWKRHFTYDGRLLHHRLRRGSRSLSPLSPSEQGVQNALLRRDPTFYWVSA